MFSYSTGYYVSQPVDQYLKFKNRCSLVNKYTVQYTRMQCVGGAGGMGLWAAEK